MPGESWAGWYRDSAGTRALTISTDGRRLHARIGDAEFTGASFDALLPSGERPPYERPPYEPPPDDRTPEGPSPDGPSPNEPPPGEAHFTLTGQGALCGCILEWDIPMQVYDDGTVHRAVLRCLLTLGRPDPAGGPGLDRLHLGLALHFDGALYESGRAESGFAGALAEIQRRLPAGSYLKSCLSCAFSDYLPAAGPPFFGGLGCFRDAKDAYRTAEGEDGVHRLWERSSGPVQETHRCPDFERRPDGSRGTGHRGPFPPPPVELIHVQGDFRPPQPTSAAAASAG